MHNQRAHETKVQEYLAKFYNADVFYKRLNSHTKLSPRSRKIPLGVILTYKRMNTQADHRACLFGQQIIFMKRISYMDYGKMLMPNIYI